MGPARRALMLHMVMVASLECSFLFASITDTFPKPTYTPPPAVEEARWNVSSIMGGGIMTMRLARDEAGSVTRMEITSDRKRTGVDPMGTMGLVEESTADPMIMVACISAHMVNMFVMYDASGHDWERRDHLMRSVINPIGIMVALFIMMAVSSDRTLLAASMPTYLTSCAMVVHAYMTHVWVDMRPASRDGTCPICLDDIVRGKIVSTLPCSHSFHVGCIWSWLDVKPHCPVCRAEVNIMPG